MEDGKQSHQSSADIDHGLDNVRPDHRRQAALKGVNQSECGDDCDRSDLPSAQGDGHHNGDCVHAHALRGGARKQEESRGQGTQAASKTPLNQLIGGVEVAAKIMWQQQEADDHATQYVAHHDLHEAQVSVIGKAGNADDSQRAGFGSHDGERNRPPRNVAVSQEIVAQRALPLAEA